MKKKEKKDCTNDYCVIWKSKGISLSKPVEEIKENFEYEKESLREVILGCNHYKKQPKNIH